MAERAQPSGAPPAAPAEQSGGRPREGRARPSGEPMRRSGERERPPGEGGERRRKRSGAGERRAGEGFGDTVERAFCRVYRHVLPPAFPVQSRPEVATIRPFVVARRDEALLLCDGAHPGPHRWPDGEAVGGEEARGEWEAEERGPIESV